MNQLSFLTLLLVSALDDCPKICPDIYEPICGTNGNDFRQFASECNLRAENCRLKRLGDNNEFVPCDSGIYRIANDISDESDSQESIEKEEKDESIAYSNPDCVRACPLIHLPVCATDGKEFRNFGNRCMLDSQNCITNNAWRMIRSGDC